MQGSDEITPEITPAQSVDRQLERLHRALAKRNVPGYENAKPYYDLIEDIIERTEAIRNNRSSTWSESIQKATFQRDENALLGVKSSFSIADSLTNVPDEELASGLEAIADMMGNPVKNINTESLEKLKKFSNSLPSSAYKKSIDTIYQASLFCALAMVTIMFPPLLPFTSPALTMLGLAVGSVIMGLACHISMKVFMAHAAEEVYDNQRFKLLHNIQELTSVTPLDEKTSKQVEDAKQWLAQIDQAKKEGTISCIDAVQALKIGEQKLSGQNTENKALADVTFSFREEGLSFSKGVVGIAANKYPQFSALVAVLAVAQVGLAAVSPAFILQTAISLAIGVGSSLGYETGRSFKEGKSNKVAPDDATHQEEDKSSNKIDLFKAAKEAVASFLPGSTAKVTPSSDASAESDRDSIRLNK